MNSASDGTVLDRPLQGAVALVTGAGHGLGRAIAMRLAAEGATTIFADLDRSAVDEAVAALDGLGAEAASLDVTDPDCWESGLGALAARHGRLDILVNCPGVRLRGPAETTAFDDWTRVIDGNFASVFYSLKFAPGLMADSRNATIINVASTLGLRGAAGASAEAASQAGVISLTRSAAQEFGHHGQAIRVNAICPGPAETADEAADQSPRPPGSDADVADAVVFLASGRARGINANILVVDGGKSA